jgi:CheY-like chemotaxis protein
MQKESSGTSHPVGSRQKFRRRYPRCYRRNDAHLREPRSARLSSFHSFRPRMKNDDPGKDGAADKLLPVAASEMNNLLQIIEGTVTMLERIWRGDERAREYFEMLHLSTARAKELMSRLTEEAGGSERKILLHPSFASPTRHRGRPSRQGKPGSLLVVDDEPMALVLSKRVFNQAGFDVMTAQSGLECLELYGARPGRFDLVLLDLTMPLLDGEETFDRLREIDPKAVVVLNTGFIEEARLAQMMSRGLAGFIRRPYQPAEAIAQIRAILAASGNRESGGAGTSPIIPF